MRDLNNRRRPLSPLIRASRGRRFLIRRDGAASSFERRRFVTAPKEQWHKNQQQATQHESPSLTEESELQSRGPPRKPQQFRGKRHAGQCLLTWGRFSNL